MVRLLQAILAVVAAAVSVTAQGSGGLPQCVKGELGCSVFSDYIEGIINPLHGFIYERTGRLHRFTPEKGVNCGEKEFGKTVSLQKNHCLTFKEKPIENMHINYRLPNNKLLNHCDITFFDGKDCRGYVVKHLNGTMQNQVINGQTYCHAAPWAKSVYLGPCA